MTVGLGVGETFGDLDGRGLPVGDRLPVACGSGVGGPPPGCAW